MEAAPGALRFCSADEVGRPRRARPRRQDPFSLHQNNGEASAWAMVTFRLGTIATQYAIPKTHAGAHTEPVSFGMPYIGHIHPQKSWSREPSIERGFRYARVAVKSRRGNGMVPEKPA
jgi:hypothetical protein